MIKYGYGTLWKKTTFEGYMPKLKELEWAKPYEEKQWAQQIMKQTKSKAQMNTARYLWA